jgi:hypothetical protein
MLRAFLFSILCFVMLPRVAAEKHTYDMYLLGNKIGTMIIEKTVRADGSEVYTLNSSATAKILWSVRNNETKYETVYKNGKLISSTHRQYENGKLDKFCFVTYDGKLYNVKNYLGTSTISESINLSIISLYFFEPVKYTRIFYDAQGDFSTIKSTEKGVYEFKSSDGNRNIYKYVNGVLQEAEFHVSIATVKIKRVS